MKANIAAQVQALIRTVKIHPKNTIANNFQFTTLDAFNPESSLAISKHPIPNVAPI